MGEISIKINIADRVYPLRVTTEEEEVIRHAAKLINEKMKELQDNYAVRDKQDLLSMCVLQYATGMIKAERNAQDQDLGLEQSVHELDTILTDFFKK
ncbi:MAG: cell division protein ZapA [Sphingobacterium sp.]|jgi:cell division protein ZapA|uniref:Cell division protein ZapA n=1 Tax=Sphingobacterium yanglingense TaxID=1437280 RepID=A0A4R6WE25_9SPHI|nr:cell division protein ZapA [Sphingobacterium yanglingense]MDR2283262.1 cell division protein ZapA [Sphingobacterium sp.]TDQ78032.1 cell division protein ZapA [Sphingobacterium yanglingense]